MDDHPDLESTQRAHGAEKKSLEAALYQAARKAPTSHKRLLAVQYTKLINQTCGGTVIAPWEVDQLDDEWLAVFMGMAADLPKMRDGFQAFEKRLQERRRANPSYRKYLN